MKILYIAEHGKQLGDNEGAIEHALTELGHTVTPIPQRKAQYKIGRYDKRVSFLLCHHWKGLDLLREFKMPKVFWCFDLINWPGDPSLQHRNEQRMQWVRAITDVCDLGFCTDGDWVAQDTTGKLTHLMQGADGRIAGYGLNMGGEPPILFAGSEKGGHDRFTFVSEMRINWKTRFMQASKLFREALADQIASSKVVVAPDSPVSDLYWSNRVYITCGFGGVMLHPYSKLLATHYEDKREIVFYHSRQQMHDLIRVLLEDNNWRRRLREGALDRTLKQHTYKHRCKQLIDIVHRRLGIN